MKQPFISMLQHSLQLHKIKDMILFHKFIQNFCYKYEAIHLLSYSPGKEENNTLVFL